MRCQSTIREIQAFTATATRDVRDEWKKSEAECRAKENELSAFILELRALVESNKKLLRIARATALSKREQLEKAGRNLRLIQGSYGSASPPAWTTLS